MGSKREVKAANRLSVASRLQSINPRQVKRKDQRASHVYLSSVEVSRPVPEHLPN